MNKKNQRKWNLRGDKKQKEDENQIRDKIEHIGGINYYMSKKK